MLEPLFLWSITIAPLIMRLRKPSELRAEMLLLLTVRVVKAPVLGVVAPTVPLMLMEAVPVRLVTTPDAGVPSAGVTRVGLVANTNAPVPVSPVTAAARFALDGVARNVVTPVPKEVSPVPPFATATVPVTLADVPVVF